MTIIDEYLIDGFIERMNNGGLSKEDEQHFITKVNELRQEIKEQAAVIKFLKKELQHKTSYRQVMKKQYRELKEKYDSLTFGLRRCETCKLCVPVIVDDKIGNACKHYFNGCNNHPVIPFNRWELDKGRFNGGTNE